MYGPSHLSLRTTAAMAADAAIVALSDKGLLGRLRTMGDWLEHLLQRLLETQRGLTCADALNLALVDGSVVCEPKRACLAHPQNVLFETDAPTAAAVAAAGAGVTGKIGCFSRTVGHGGVAHLAEITAAAAHGCRRDARS